MFASIDYKDEQARADQLRTELRMEMQHRMEKAKKRYGLALIVLFVWAASLMIGCCLTGVIVHKKTEAATEERVTHEMRASMQAYIEEQERQSKAAAFLTGEDSIQAAIDDIAEPLSVHIATLRQDRKVTEAGAETYGWVDIARWLSGTHGATLHDVLTEPNQIESYVEGHAVRNEDLAIAKRIATMVVNGVYPDGFTINLQYAQINADGSVTARDSLKTDSMTTFWRISSK